MAHLAARGRGPSHPARPSRGPRCKPALELAHVPWATRERIAENIAVGQDSTVNWPPSPRDPYRHALVARRPPRKARPFCFLNYLVAILFSVTKPARFCSTLTICKFGVALRYALALAALLSPNSPEEYLGPMYHGPCHGSALFFRNLKNRLELDHLKAAAQHEGAGGRCECAGGARVAACAAKLLVYASLWSFWSS